MTVNLKIMEVCKFLSEINQSMDIKFSFVHKIDDNNYEQIMTEVKCRDFLGDLMYSKTYSKPVDTYGFQYDYSKNPYDEDKLRMSLKFPNEETKNNFLTNSINLIRDIEKKANVEPSVFYHIKDSNYLIIESDKHWQSEVWKLSLFTYYLKIASYKDLSCITQPELYYKNRLDTSKKEDYLLSKLTLDNKDKISENIREAHNDSGFISLISGNHYLSKQKSFWEENK